MSSQQSQDPNQPVETALDGPSPPDIYDCVIVGGGPAGLSAALILGRCLRRVLVCDAGRPRNAASHALHGYLSRDGTPPGEFLEIARAELRPYTTVSLREVEVEAIEPAQGRFTLTLDSGEHLRARTVLLAPGLVDQLPELQNFKLFYGVSVHSCPYCDAWEHRGQPLAVLGSDPESVDLALELRIWSEDILLCTNGAEIKDPACGTALLKAGIPVTSTAIASLEGEGAHLQRIVFTDGTESQRQALFFSPCHRSHSLVARLFGCELDDPDGCIKSGPEGSTDIPGLFVAGNARHGLQLIVVAAAAGARAACAINNALLEQHEAERAEP